MASTRDVTAPPIFAEDASTTIPPTPIAGQSYRDPVAGPASSPDGWPYAQLVNSAEWNQLMFQWSSLISIMEKRGIVGWSDLTNYTEPAITFGSDGKIYLWLQESGPGTGAGAQDPVSSPLYWSQGLVGQASETIPGIIEIATQPEMDAVTDDTRAVTPLKIGFGFSFNKTASGGHLKLPAWMGGFIFNWGTYVGAQTAHTFDLPYPTVCAWASANGISTTTVSIVTARTTTGFTTNAGPAGTYFAFGW